MFVHQNTASMAIAVDRVIQLLFFLKIRLKPGMDSSRTLERPFVSDRLAYHLEDLDGKILRNEHIEIIRLRLCGGAAE